MGFGGSVNESTIQRLSEWVTAPLDGSFKSQSEWLEEFRVDSEMPKLDTPVFIYRGTTRDEFENGKWGMSWTTNKSVAVLYCGIQDRLHGRRSRGNKVVLQTMASPRAVLADLRVHGNLEGEIIVDPEALGDVSIAVEFNKSENPTKGLI